MQLSSLTYYPPVFLKHWFSKLLLAFILLAGTSWLYLFDPQYILSTPPCLFKKFTGFDCPGCGSARACHQLLHGHVLKAIDYNLLLVFLLPFLLAYAIGQLKNSPVLWTAKIYKPRFIFWLVISFWLLRNIPVFPFFYLNSGH